MNRNPIMLDGNELVDMEALIESLACDIWGWNGETITTWAGLETTLHMAEEAAEEKIHVRVQNGMELIFA